MWRTGARGFVIPERALRRPYRPLPQAPPPVPIQLENPIATR